MVLSSRVKREEGQLVISDVRFEAPSPELLPRLRAGIQIPTLAHAHYSRAMHGPSHGGPLVFP